MISIIKPILIAFATSTAVKVLVLDILAAMVKESENKLDDQLVAAVRKAILGE